MPNSITIIGVNQDGEQVSETIAISGESENRTFYSCHRYRALGTEKQSLRFRVRRLSLWRRFVLRFFKKWPVVSGGIQ